jgi:DNA-binding winged helix-turn-helix (wHTH) protein/tetratricopeptide (TPR) repeat protein
MRGAGAEGWRFSLGIIPVNEAPFLALRVFPPFQLDTVNQCLWRGEDRVPLTPKAFDVLRYLVEHTERLVTHDEIREAVWPETHVSQEVLKQYIRGIRKALGDDAESPTFVATFPRRGYQFVAQVGDEALPDRRAAPRRRIVGREADLARLTACLDEALEGQRQVVFVSGEAGIGKTTLLDAFHEQCASRPKVRTTRGQCIEGFGGKEPYYPLLEALGHWLGGAAGAPMARALARRAPTWLVQFPSLVSAEQRESLDRDVFGTTRERMVREICEALEAFTVENPLVLVLEDLHWVDPSTLDVVSALARRRGPARLLLVGTYRPADADPARSLLKALKQDLRAHLLCEEIVLAPLEEPAIAEYLAAELEAASVPPGLTRLVHRHSGGNPLFMAAIVQDMVTSGVLARDPQGLGVTVTRPVDDVDPGVPDTLQQMLEHELDRLTPSEQRVLSAASVAGERFAVWSIAAAVEMSPEEIEDLCDGLAARELFVVSAGFEELADGTVSAHYEFRHSLHRQVLYRRLSAVVRSRLHRLLGERLETLCAAARTELAAELAMRFEEGHDYERAIRHLIVAAENAVRRFAHRDSISLIEHALALSARVAPERRAALEVQLLETKGDVHYWLGAMSDSARAYEAAARRAGRAGFVAAQVDALCGLVRPFGLIDPDRSIAAVEQAVGLASGLGDPLVYARAEMLAAGTRLMYDAWRDEDWARCEAARQRLVRPGPGLPAYPRMIYAHLQILRGDYAASLENLEAGIPKADEPTGPMVYFFALSGQTLALLHSGRFGELVRVLEAGKERAERNGIHPWLFLFREAWLRTLVLDFDGAQRICEGLVGSGAPPYPTGQPETIARLAAGYAALDRGEHADAARRFEEILDADVTPKFFLHWYWRMSARLGLGNVALASGDLAQARAASLRFAASADTTADPNLRALARELAARVALAEDDTPAAEEHARSALAIVDERAVPTVAWRVHATAYDVYRRKEERARAEAHRAQAEGHILALAGSFGPDEPLRRSFMDASAVRRVLGG